jgi:ubiquitin carboxyl-terminal hydrolase 7
VNDHYEFPLKFDASPYLASEADKSEPWTYVLHGVLVHSGDFNAGHYYAYLKPTKDGFFYRFDDERVTRATESEVTKENFGGDHGANGVPNRNEYARINTNIKRSMSAYMLVYIRESRIDEILPELTPQDTPAHLGKFTEDAIGGMVLTIGREALRRRASTAGGQEERA